MGPALGNYLRTVLRENRSLDSSQTILAQVSAEATDTEISNEFQSFLETLQGDLVGAVREYAAPAPSPTAETDRLLEVVESVQEGQEAIPRFHHQLGQTLPGTRRSSGVTGDDIGEPRRLTFFRAYRFPQVPNGAENVVPCIFITVRSIRHDPNLTSEELLQHPSFPFIDGHVPSPPNDVDETTGSSTSSGPAGPSSTTPITGRRNLRQRVMDRLSSRRSTSPTGPYNTYLVSVIGGNYPPSHPVLAIPNLITGGSLTNEEMQLIGELLGPVKPPTASMEDIEKAGLSIIDGSEMASRAEKGEVLASCVERCLVSRSRPKRMGLMEVDMLERV